MIDFRQKLATARVPVFVSLELTRRCNLRCVHCYLGEDEGTRGFAAAEMNTDEVRRVIDELVEAGCLYLLITGGEPMMRRDFVEIYRYAKTKGLVITVFCNGLLVDDAVIDVFRELPPRLVEISLYGATDKTYEAMTRVKGSLAKCLGGVRRLTEAGINVGLKTVLTTLNLNELEAMRDIAREMDVPFRMDAEICPALSSRDCTPLTLRVDPEIGVECDFADERVVDAWREYVDDRSDMPVTDRLYNCGAAVTSLSIDPFGWASPCLMATHVRANILERGLEEIWNGEFKNLLEKKAPDNYACSSCEMRVACGVCPAFNYLETGEEDVRSDYVCATAVARWRRITGKNPVGLPVINQTAGT